MKKTKITATLGPATKDYGKIRELISAGVNVFRMNFSHGDYGFFSALLSNIKRARLAEGQPVAILQDLQGPKIRVKQMSASVIVKRGEALIIEGSSKETRDKSISIDFKGLYKYVKTGSRILINDGMVSLRVEKIKSGDIYCTVINGGEIAGRKGVNLPGVKLPLSSMTKKDKENLKFGLKKGVEIVSLSFVRTADDVIALKKEIAKQKKCRPIIIAKIEKPEAVKNIKAILHEADGIMVARGDLAVEAGYKKIPGIQKKIVTLANEEGKIVIVATQMLESMTNNPYPERAEITDVYNAVLDGADALMLSGETSVGKYPVKTVRVMSDIIKKAEAESLKTCREKTAIKTENNYENTLSYAAAAAQEMLPGSEVAVNANTIEDVSYISDYRPKKSVICVTRDKDLYNKMAVYHSIQPVLVKGNNPEKSAAEIARKIRNVKNLIYVEYGGSKKRNGSMTLLKVSDSK